MKTKFLISLCFALCFYGEVYAEGEQEVRRGQYPFMAFLYYPDESVVDGSGNRFLRGAVLIRSDWLVTSAVGPSVQESSNGFPQKTLIARLGAVTIDANYTLNEDEDEQEREVIQIVRPYNHSATQWWRTDISLMKTLLPFNMTSAVSSTSLSPRRDYIDKTCTILVFAKKDINLSEDRILLALTVELLPPSVQNCGPNFVANSMTCASDSEENKNTLYDSSFCQGNSGGPLICEGDVMGLQTYIDNDCKQPHLYQLLSAWDNFISCGTDEKCLEGQCSNICDVAHKDPLPTLANEIDMPTTTSTAIITVATQDSATDEPETTVGNPMITTVQSGQEETSTDVPTTHPSVHELKGDNPRPTDVENKETRSWPNEKYSDSNKKIEGDAESPRKTSVEAQQQDIKIKRRGGRSSASKTQTLHFGFIILACLI